MEMASQELFEENNKIFYHDMSPEMIDNLLRKFQAVFTAAIVITQAFNLFACKTRMTYPFGKHMFTNYRNFAGLVIGFALIFFILFCPIVKNLFHSEVFTPEHFGIPILGGVVLLIYSALRFYISQKLNPTHFNREITGLQMHPTVRTVKSPTDIE
ncbi:hypothetical protein DSO57_1027493 [Entomophthora muscae]|uniref:Uncharacterized protein n=1 Tax=Entomophthora muscae TaxID=34485 RepID=A0ACC2SQP5_9FUNG|nr:hypothetical protein DSO57_1027493 [Entomophthora muscae]